MQNRIAIFLGDIWSLIWLGEDITSSRFRSRSQSLHSCHISSLLFEKFCFQQREVPYHA